ncbi:MAG: sugar ABC transporter substrate-binding protein [Treponema sp.]|jgi:multiple sugar transport system substrate-binding protein|nr:sugar ABC transporter substrate-binding protein [Treponema sp.]
MKKVILAAILCAAAVLLTAGCKSKEPPRDKEGRLILKVPEWDATTNSYYGQIITAFEAAHPDIKVEPIDIPSNDYTQKLAVMLNGGSDVDAFWVKDGDTTRGLFSRGQLLDLKPFIERDGIDLSVYNGLAERYVMDGKQIALPASSANYVLYYNKDRFDDAGIPYPPNDLTWQQFEELARRLTSGSTDTQDKIWGAHFHFWPACVQNWAVQDGQHTIVETDYSFMKPYYEMVLRMQNDGITQKFASLKQANIAYTNAFLSSKFNVAMLPMGFWFAPTIIDRIKRGETEPFNWGMAQLPHPEGVPAGWTVGSVTPIAISARSRSKEAAWEFVKFVTSEEGARIYAANGAYPCRMNDELLQVLASVAGMPEGTAEAIKTTNIVFDRPMVDSVAEINQMLDQEHGRIMLGEITIDQGLAAMATRAQEILNQ